MAFKRIALLSGAVACGACSAFSTQSLHVPATQVRPAVMISPRGKGDRGPASPVEQSLRARGIRFGTDGTAPALFAFVRERFPEVPLEKTGRGDVLFFDMGTGCGGHTGLVETVEPGGRIGFRERREGNTRHSYVTPRTPYARRDAEGRVLNTFLRPKRMDDEPGTRYFAGDMLCAIFHVEEPPW
jgi:hypothetical protein